MTDFLTLTVSQVEAMNEADTQAALNAWVAAGRTELPEALVNSKSKAHAKLAKKAIYQLKSKGLAVEAPKQTEALAAPLPESAPEEFPAVISHVLGTGERAIFFARPVRGGGLEVYQGIISDELGIVAIEGGTAKRATYRKRMRELENEQNVKVMLVPWERMRFELGRALVQCERANAKPPDETMDIVRTLGVDPVQSLLEVGPLTPEKSALAARGAELAKEKELEQWLPSEPAIKQLSEKIKDVETSFITADVATRHSTARPIVQAVVSEYLTTERRAVYARRLEAMGELYDACKRPDAANLARAEAARLMHSTEPSAFVETMFMKVIDQRAEALQQAAATVTSPAGRLSMPPSLGAPR